ncbi:S8 family serine peptidase [Thalassotalea crassostreae]|uniref:S8 family serine peptidase n=1 Tax=Thalassotalea crassostreae TaxID=1763536 RepID=UPI0008391F4A|nr:S8 family serine peptidase [Thalassotalea crassostreae]
MKLKQIAIAATSTLYMSAVAAAAVSLPVVENRIDLPDFQQSDLPEYLKQAPVFEHQQVFGNSESKFAQVNRLTGLPMTNGANIQYNRKDKFVPEDGIEGVQQYFVSLHDRPAAQYTGGIPGLAATHLATVAQEHIDSNITTFKEGNEINLKRLKASDEYKTRVANYKEYIASKQAEFIDSAYDFGFSIQAETQYDVAVNAFTTSMTQEEAIKLAELSSVKGIHRVTLHQIQGFTDARNDVAGVHDIIDSYAAWDLDAKGEGIIVGVADTGINTDHPSFADFDGHRFYTDRSGITWETADAVPYDHVNPWGAGNYVGDCLKDGFEHMCNDKLIGVRSYTRLTDQYSKTALIDHVMDKAGLDYNDLYSESGKFYAVPPVGEDHAGHGSHTAGTAAGNNLKSIKHHYREIDGPGLAASREAIGNVTGVAPRANVIAYQVCISANSNSGYAGCLLDVMLETVEDVIEDGVDVLNWSLGGAPYDAWEHPLGQAFLSAYESGVHINVAAGNSGYQGTVKHSAPWITTVGATQTNRKEVFTNTSDLSQGADLQASIDGQAYDLVSSQRMFSISGEHDNGRAVLGEFMGACVENDCSEAPVCKIGFEMLDDGLCYQECTEDEFRNPDTLACNSFGIEDLPDQKDPANCLIGTEWVDINDVSTGAEWGCLDINREVPANYTTRESICPDNVYGGDDAVFPSLTDTGSPYWQQAAQRFYCPGIDYDDAHPNYRGRLGGSYGIVCAYGVEYYWETEFSNGLTRNNKDTIVYWDGDDCKDSDEENCVPEDRDGDGENSTIDEPTLGQCRVKAPDDRDYDNYDLRYGNSSGPAPATQAFGLVSERPVLTDYVAPEPLIKQSRSKTSASTQATVVGIAPELRVFEGDLYCENLDEWRDPSDVTKPYNFDDAIVFCARGTGNNIDFNQKSKNVQEVAERDAINAGRSEEEVNASIVVYNDSQFYSSLFNFPSRIPFVQIQKESWENDFEPFFKGGEISEPSSLVELQRERRLTITSLYSEIQRIEEDDDRYDHVLANFTSKGPHYFIEDLMPVQVMAPGVNIFAAWTDNAVLDKGYNSADFGFANGTSMATPVVSGAFAIFKQARPNWTNAERQSALTMTSKEVIYTEEFINEADYDADNPDHSKSSTLVPKTNEEGELVFDADGNLEMIEIAIYKRIVNVNSWHVGTGLIDLDAAINTGLVLDETLDKMLAANPSAGGDARQLNMPYMFDGSCPETCTWLRTFKAKRSGSWSINIDKFESAVEIESSIDSFTLDAGETVTVMFTAKIDRAIAQSQYQYVIDGSGFTGGEVEIVATDPSIPTLRLPVGVSLDTDTLPTLVKAESTSTVGRYPIDLSMPAMSTDELSTKLYHQNNTSYIDTDENGELATSSFGVTELQASTGYGQTWIGRTELNLDQSRRNFDFETAHNDPSIKLVWVDVPEDTKMLVVDTIRKVSTNAHTSAELRVHSGTLMMVVGRDIVEPGRINPLQEITCASVAENLENFCYIVDPQPGKYWVLMQNTNDLAPFGIDWLKDTYDYAISVVSADASPNLILDAPETANPAQDILQMDLVYSIDTKEHEVSYALAELYSNEYATSADMGSVPIRLYRKEEPVSVTFNRTNKIETQENAFSASPGSYVKVELDVAANHSGYDRAVNVNVNLPEGVTYVRNAISGDVRFVTGYAESENGEGMSLSLYQPNTHRLGKGYIQSTNINPEDPKNSNHPYVLNGTHNYDAQCRTPAVGNYANGTSTEGGYVDIINLNPAYGRTMFGEDTYVDLEQLFNFDSQRNYDLNLYDGPRSHTEFKVSPSGYISAGYGMTEDTKYFGPTVYPFNEVLLAPLFRKGIRYNQTVDLKSTRDLLPNESINTVEGMTMAVFADGIEWKLLVEWDNAYTVQGDQDYGDSMDFQAWFDIEHSYKAGAYEVMFAYDNLDMLPPLDNFQRNDAIGMQGLDSDRHFFGLINPPRREFFAYNNIEEVLYDDLVVCYDYYGPDYSESSFIFWVRVDDDTAGKDLNIEIEKQIASSTVITDYTISVPSQITIADFNQVIVEQGSTVTMPVYYADSNLTANSVNAYADHLNVSVDGNEPGAMLTIDAACSFTGDTTVTVEIADMHNNSDVATKDIDVRVIAKSGYSADECSTLRPDDETESEVEANADDDSGSSGGSFGFLLLLALAGFRFRKVNG